MQNFYKDLVE
jgi:hypothetical protein